MPRSFSSQAQLPCGMWDLSTLIRDQTLSPCSGSWILNHLSTLPGKSPVCISNEFLGPADALGLGLTLRITGLESPFLIS